MAEVSLPQHSQTLGYLESRLPPLQEYHDTTVRYIRAGFYLDAIHSVLEGFAKCNVPTEMQHNRTSISIDTVAVSSESTLMDRNPMDPHVGSRDNCSEELLVLAMIYNLALSYHLYALTTTTSSPQYTDTEHDRQVREQMPMICSDSFHLYEESRIRLRHLRPALKASLYSVPAMENNMQHVSSLLQQKSR
ncbi:unnamed protein product [Cylindrotheca closterium]|uniref:Uncharacterized protein n=1 Tax=Cylindrotheca closterium TaxID=2856 RepID=A0AAD2GAP8_9STRA|nr:unnamed protein product [Cylindrotheca closterium]